MPDPTDILKTLASGGASKVSKNPEKQTSTIKFTRRSYVAPKPPKPKPSETGKKETLQKEASPTPKPKQESIKRKDIERLEETVEKANNDQSVIENYNNSDDNSNSSFNPYKDFGGG